MSNEKTAAPAIKVPDSKSIRREKLLPIIFVYAVLIGLVIVAQILRPGFAAPGNLENVLRTGSFLGIVCIGQTLVILTAGIDLAVPYTVVLCNVITSQVINGDDKNTFLALAICILVGAVAGFVVGLGIYYLRIPPMVMTLAIGNVLYGFAYIYSGGAPSGRRSPMLDHFVNGRFMGITYGSVIAWVILAVIFIIILKKTTFGRSIYMLGTNVEAAKYSGTRAGTVTIAVYMIHYILCGFVGFLMLGYTGTAYLSTGANLGNDSIAAVVVGGVSVLGGKGGYVGALAGALIMTVITSLMNMFNIPEAGRQVVQGVLIIALLLIMYRRRK